jgi:FkbM family methyltransferase
MIRYLRLVRYISNWWLHFAAKIGVTKKDPLLFQTRRQIRIEVPRRLYHEFKEIFMEGCYTDGLTGAVPEHPTIVDIGANVGFFSFFAASRFPGARIFAYEPIPTNFNHLLRNRDLNRKVHITCIPKAVYGYSGEVTLELDSDDSFSTAARVTLQPQSPLSAFRAPCITLADLLDAHGIKRCHLLKIDCEGAEYDILYNCPQTHLHRIDQMVIEVHRGTAPEQTMESLSGFLESRGFHTHRSHHMHMLWVRRS